MRPVLALGLALTAGCLGWAPSGQLGLAEAGGGDERLWPVVGLVDTGINPWHRAFALDDPGMRPPTWIPHEVLGEDFRARVASEGPAAYLALTRGQVYWFEGTRVLAVSEVLPVPDPTFREILPEDPHPIFDDANHGTATASVVARIAPHAWIVMVETHRLTYRAFRWVGSADWIDIATTSIGTIGSLPQNETDGPDGHAEGMRRVVARGGLSVAAAGNHPSPNLLYMSGAPWVTSVGAAEWDRRGVVPLTSQPVDVVANFTWHGLAWNRSNDETWSGKGTSFGAPAVAGVLAEAIYRARVAVGHERGEPGVLVSGSGVRLTNADVRAALNASASYWGVGDYRLHVNASEFPTVLPYEVTNPALPAVGGTPVGPWLQMGWGYVDEATIGVMVEVLLGRASLPEKSDAAAHMARVQGFREAVWDVRQGS